MYLIVYAAIVKTPLAGDFITNECIKLMAEQKIEVVPPYTIESKVNPSYVTSM